METYKGQNKKEKILLAEYAMLSRYVGDAIGLRFAMFGACLTGAIFFVRVFNLENVDFLLEVACAICVASIPIVLTFVIAALTRLSYLYSFRMKEIAEELEVTDCFWATWSTHSKIRKSESGIVASKYILFFMTYMNFFLISAYFLHCHKHSLEEKNGAYCLFGFMIIMTIATTYTIIVHLNQDRLHNLVKTWYFAKKFNEIFLMIVDRTTSGLIKPIQDDCDRDPKGILSILSFKLRSYMGIKRRKYLRRPLKTPIAYTWNNEKQSGIIQNISEGGAFIEGGDPPIGDRIVVLFDGNNKSTTKDIRISGKIIRSRNNFFAVEFAI